MGRDALTGRPLWIPKKEWNKFTDWEKVAIMNFDYTSMTDEAINLFYDECGNELK